MTKLGCILIWNTLLKPDNGLCPNMVMKISRLYVTLSTRHVYRNWLMCSGQAPKSKAKQ